MSIKLRVAKPSDFSRDYGFAVVRVSHDVIGTKTIDIVRPVQFESRVEGEDIPATFHLGPEQVHELMDRLWAIGVRPSCEDHTGEINATKRHLDDMRKLLFEGKP